MAKNLLYKLFGLRKVPADLRKRFEEEGIAFDEEGTSCALGYKQFKGPRNASHRGWQGAVSGTLIVTKKSLYIHLPYLLICDKPAANAVRHIELELRSATELLMKFDVEMLFDGATGGLTCLWRTNNAEAIDVYLRELSSNDSAV